MKKQWHIHRPDNEKVKAISRHLNCSSITAAILCNRKIESPQSAADFLSFSLHNLTSPDTIQDMNLATERIERAVLFHEKILIIGDYDVDGVAATAMLFSFLKQMGAKVTYHIPHRITEGYGLSSRHIRKIALPMEIKLIITVDNGSASHNAVKAANAYGMDVIVTDHHRTFATLPNALAVINPKRMDCDSNLEYLSGVGVAFYMLICLRKRLRENGFWQKKKEPNLKSWCDLVALGTIADMVPMIADNRILTKIGLDLINRAPRPGISALIQSSKIGGPPIDTEDVAFRLAPRLNAAGRMEHANSALELLLAPNLTTAQSLSKKLNDLNRFRKDTENTIVNSIELMLASPFWKNRKSITIGKEGWHEGVLGIAAARISHRFIKPTIVFTLKNGRAKGSARSIPGLDVYAAILACKKDLIQFGGHTFAAGLTLRSADLTSFNEQFEDTIANMTEASHFIEKIIIDYELFFENIDPPLLDELEALQPFGQNNPAPLFMAKNIEILSTTLLSGNHRRMLLRQQGHAHKRLQAIQFNVNPNEKPPEKMNQMAFRLQWNHWNGSRKIQLIVEET
jgi:single-stranded-DNA-specific exonuclease